MGENFVILGSINLDKKMKRDIEKEVRVICKCVDETLLGRLINFQVGKVYTAKLEFGTKLDNNDTIFVYNYDNKILGNGLRFSVNGRNVGLYLRFEDYFRDYKMYERKEKLKKLGSL